jgi:hypothetical protein
VRSVLFGPHPPPALPSPPRIHSRTGFNREPESAAGGVLKSRKEIKTEAAKRMETERRRVERMQGAKARKKKADGDEGEGEGAGGGAK